MDGISEDSAEMPDHQLIVQFRFRASLFVLENKRISENRGCVQSAHAASNELLVALQYILAQEEEVETEQTLSVVGVHIHRVRGGARGGGGGRGGGGDHGVHDPR